MNDRTPNAARLRPSHWSLFGFRFVPLLLFAAGTVAVIYGAGYHRVALSETHDEEIQVAVPVTPSMRPSPGPDGFPGPAGFPGPGGPPDLDAGPPVKFVTRIKTVKEAFSESEMAVNRAATIGVLTRNDDGELFRVAGAGNGGPAFCPT